MQESKIDVTDRMRREGRLEAFNLRRDEIRSDPICGDQVTASGHGERQRRGLVAAEEKSIDQLRARLDEIVQESKQSCRREDLARCSDQEIQTECERRAIACNGQPK